MTKTSRDEEMKQTKTDIIDKHAKTKTKNKSTSENRQKQTSLKNEN